MTPLDWAGAHARLRAARARLDAIDQAAGDAEAVLRARAEAIARAAATPAPADVVDLVVFRLSGTRYAVEAVEVAEAVDVAGVTALPGVPDFYRGLLMHRGTIFSLLDVRPLIGAPADDGGFAHALVLHDDARAIALGADEVEALVRLPTATLSALRNRRAAGTAPAIAGTTADGVVVLDARVLLGDARLVVDD